MVIEPGRGRRIVKMAARMTRLKMPKRWLEDDEHGMWEKMAIECITVSASTAEKVGMTEGEVDREVAGMLLLSALSSCAEYMRKKAK